MRECIECNKVKPKKCVSHIFLRPYQDVSNDVLIRDVAHFINEIEHAKAKVDRMRKEIDMRTMEVGK